MASEKRLYRSVLEKLQGLIDTGEYRPGGRLPPERELAQRFNVSRPTVREAIIALEALGRVEVKVRASGRRHRPRRRRPRGLLRQQRLRGQRQKQPDRARAQRKARNNERRQTYRGVGASRRQ